MLNPSGIKNVSKQRNKAIKQVITCDMSILTLWYSALKWSTVCLFYVHLLSRSGTRVFGELNKGHLHVYIMVFPPHQIVLLGLFIPSED